MLDLGELLKDVPSEVQTRVYDRMVTLDEPAQERLAREITEAIASSPAANGSAAERGAAREAREAAAPRVGEPAPDFNLALLEGDRRVSLGDHRGRPVGLIFGSYT